MKLYLENDNGERFPIKEIEETFDKDCGVLFFMVDQLLTGEKVHEMQDFLQQKTGKECIVLDRRFTKVLGI